MGRGVMVLVGLLTALPVTAQPRRRVSGPCGEVALVPGAVAVRFCAGGTPVSWLAQGFTFGDHPELAQAWSFSGDGLRRIVASVGHGVLYSDSLGASWSAAAWPDLGAAEGLAMDIGGGFGVATAGGAVYTTQDNGASWSYLRTQPGAGVYPAAVLGQHAVLVEPRGGVWLLLQGAEWVTLIEAGHSPYGGPARVTRAEDSVRIDSGAVAWRLQRNGSWAPLSGP